MRFFFAAIFTVIQAIAVHADAPPEVVKASVRVDVPQGGGVVNSGSGTVVALYTGGDGKPCCVVLTNRHVCPTNCEIKVVWPWNTFVATGHWIGADDNADLAGLWCLAPPDATACPPADETPAIGESVHQVGYPRTCGPVIRRGPALAYGGETRGGVPIFQAKLRSADGFPIISGDSGSGLFNAKGELVAINWGVDDISGDCQAVNLWSVHRFLAGRPGLAKLFPRLAERREERREIRNARWTEALGEVNALRAARGLRPYIRDDALTSAAAGCAEFRADRLMAGHTSNDFAAIPSGTAAAASGCAAWPVAMGWGSCATFENHTYAGAAYVTGADGKRYMHLFVR